MVNESQPFQESRSVAKSKPGRYAVIVGVNDYSQSDVGDLSFCAADAEAFYDALLTYCEYEPDHIILFSDGNHQDAKKPLRSDILASVRSMCNSTTDSDSILLFFAGHGTRDSEDSYLLTQEYREVVTADTGIPMNMINGYFRQSKARFKMRFFDACHAGRIGTRATSLRSPDIKKHFLVEAEGWTTLSACKEDQFAHEDASLGHGIFSYFLIKGLGGAAAIGEHVTLDSLKMYVITQTSEVTKQLGLRQTPVSDSFQVGNLVA